MATREPLQQVLWQSSLPPPLPSHLPSCGLSLAPHTQVRPFKRVPAPRAVIGLPAYAYARPAQFTTESVSTAALLFETVDTPPQPVKLSTSVAFSQWSVPPVLPQARLSTSAAFHRCCLLRRSPSTSAAFYLFCLLRVRLSTRAAFCHLPLRPPCRAAFYQYCLSPVRRSTWAASVFYPRQSSTSEASFQCCCGVGFYQGAALYQCCLRLVRPATRLSTNVAFEQWDSLPVLPSDSETRDNFLVFMSSQVDSLVNYASEIF